MRTRDAGLVAVVVFGWSGVTAGGVEPGNLPIQIRLYGVTASNVAIADNARRVADPILQDVGLSPIWIDCSGTQPPAVCHSAPRSDEFLIRIAGVLPGAPHACGASLKPREPLRGHFITIFADCVRRGADRVHVSEAVVFAYALIHELGHLLLPEGHSPHGVMRARPDRFDWIRAARGSLRFTPEQGRQMRATMQRQMLMAEGRP